MKLDNSEDEPTPLDDENFNFLNSIVTIDIYRWELEEETFHEREKNNSNQTAAHFYKLMGAVCPTISGNISKSALKGKKKFKFNQMAVEATSEAIERQLAEEHDVVLKSTHKSKKRNQTEMLGEAEVLEPGMKRQRNKVKF